LTPYVTYEVIEVGKTHGIRPDVGVWRLQSSPPESRAAAGVVTTTPVESRVALEIPLRLHRVEIRAMAAQELVTVIEILSPVNKRPGHEAHRDYQRKRRDILRSPVHLLELDLLRGGERPPLEEPVPTVPYYVTLSREGYRPVVTVWPIQLADSLPVLPIPLLEPDPDASLDLAAAVASVYDRGAYASQIDYRQPPPPPILSETESIWLDQRLRDQGRR
jgi:hypothetical protein